MKRFLQLRRECTVEQFDDTYWAIFMELDFNDVVPLCLELFLTLYALAESLALRFSNSRELIIGLTQDARSEVDRQSDERLRISLRIRDMENLCGYVLQYYRDSVAPVDHIDIDLECKGDLGCSATLIVKVSRFTPPMSAEEARRELEKE